MQTDIEQKALAYACECAGRSVHHFDRMGDDLPLRASIIAHARAIEQHEAFRQEVSDAVTGFDEYGTEAAWERLSRFIIPKPDPLVEVLQEISGEGGYDNFDHYAYRLRSALEARGLEVRKIGEGE